MRNYSHGRSFFGFMEGAPRSGRRVANAIVNTVAQTLTWDRHKRLDGHDVYSVTWCGCGLCVKHGSASTLR